MILVGAGIAYLDTPALLIDLNRLEANICRVADQTRVLDIDLRPHTKTHKLPPIAWMQCQAGACGITVAKLGEAEVMAAAGLQDIFIANQIVGAVKLERLRYLAHRTRLCVGLDHRDQAMPLSQVFEAEVTPLDVMIEIDTGQRRTGVPPGTPAIELAEELARLPGLAIRGIYTHEGHDYAAPDRTTLARVARESQAAMLITAEQIGRRLGQDCMVSIGSTPSLITGEIDDGIDELRPGTYALFDASMSNIVGHTDWCAATVLATVVNCPTPERIVIDAGAKALSAERRPQGTLLHTPGFGCLLENPTIAITSLSDEHGVIEDPQAAATFAIGDRVRVIPSHVCPTVNLYDTVYAVRGDIVEAVWQVAARGKTQ